MVSSAMLINESSVNKMKNMAAHGSAFSQNSLGEFTKVVHIYYNVTQQRGCFVWIEVVAENINVPINIVIDPPRCCVISGFVVSVSDMLHNFQCCIRRTISVVHHKICVGSTYTIVSYKWKPIIDLGYARCGRTINSRRRMYYIWIHIHMYAFIRYALSSKTGP